MIRPGVLLPPPPPSQDINHQLPTTTDLVANLMTRDSRKCPALLTITWASVATDSRSMANNIIPTTRQDLATACNDREQATVDEDPMGTECDVKEPGRAVLALMLVT